MTKKYSDYTL